MDVRFVVGFEVGGDLFFDVEVVGSFYEEVVDSLFAYLFSFSTHLSNQLLNKLYKLSTNNYIILIIINIMRILNNLSKSQQFIIYQKICLNLILDHTIIP